MIVHKQVPLSSLTTLKVGGPARYVVECLTADDVREGVLFAREQGVPFAPLGEGSNVLASDHGYDGVVLHIRIGGIETDESQDTVLLQAGAGVIWDTLVDLAIARGLWGVENLAGIPGTVGAAPVQNIGAYGAELADTLEFVDTINTETGEEKRLLKSECEFGYRESRFKREKHLVITRVALRLQKSGAPQVGYKDLQARLNAGEPLRTPREIARTVRTVRAQKFPDLRVLGTAGSFFKNPFISATEYDRLRGEYPELPGFIAGDVVKIPIAWILDHALTFRGFSMGPVSLFERQPLVLVAEPGASASDVESLAQHVASEVERTTGIRIEREVRMFP